MTIKNEIEQLAVVTHLSIIRWLMRLTRGYRCLNFVLIVFSTHFLLFKLMFVDKLEYLFKNKHVFVTQRIETYLSY